jgi:RNA polymerase sigma factor (sigma-70 family)
MTQPGPPPEMDDLVPLEPDASDSDDDWDEAQEPVAAAAATVDGAQDESLERLIARVMHQDETALAALYGRLGAPVYSLALQITRSIGSAEEVLQDVFWQVWRQAPRFDRARGSVPAWVLTIARSRALDAVRSHMRSPHAHASAQDEFDEGLPSPDPGPQDLLYAAQQGSRLQVALEGLDPLRRQLVSLSFYRGLSQQEIADQTGLPLGTVKSHLRRSMATLRDVIGSDLAPAPG